MAEKETGNNDDLMKEFSEFLEAKRASEQEEKDSEDFDVEIWDEKGRGVRTRRSHAKPFLNSLGIDVDPPAKDEGVEDDKGGTKKPARKPPAKSESTVRKYFTPAAKGK
jgi:hypothetical protein